SNAADILKATVTADAEFAQWKIDVKQIAAKQQVYSNQFDPTATMETIAGITSDTSFKIRVGAQVSEIIVKKTDTIRTINQQIALAKDQNGDKLLVTSKIIDNRLVFESAVSGIDNTGVKASETLTYAGGGTTYLPKAASGTSYPTTIADLKVNGNPYTNFTYDNTNGEITWITAPPPAPSAGDLLEIQYDTTTAGYNYSTDNNEFVLDDGGSNLLEDLGLIEMVEYPPSSGIYINNKETKASNAIINVNGIEVTRPDNVIEDLIAGVKLELVGLGDVTMNITQDAQKAVDAVQAFTDAYNEVLTWINEKLAEKYSSATVEDDDFLQNLLDSTDKSTVFGVLHGDQLLSSIKNQLRNMVANSVTSTSLALATRKYAFTDVDLELSGQFYVYAAGQALKIDVVNDVNGVNGDSLEDIRDKIATYFSVTSKDGSTATGDDLKLNAFIRNGQLVVEYNSASTLESPRTDVIARNHANTGTYDVLPYTPTKEAPISGKFTVQVGEATTDALGNTVPPTYYQEGVDFEIVNDDSSGDKIVSKINWLGSNKPADNQSYKVTYEYNPTAVAFSIINGDDLKTLDFHTDASKSQLSSFGLKTTSVDFGKSGLLEFDSDTLFAALAADGNTTSSVMTGFFRSLDTYIGNLVDTSQVIVAGTSVTKGRVANAMLTIDNEVDTLTAQIAKLEKQLADRQTSMYKQYSEMETAIQKLNSQMSSLSQYLSSTSSS
ncbi:MAG: flagellar filament capping protein FliD, partial [Synergistaceae bacterium]|nr:flagellar filament capping protein FliD [Synergistaceae bacterium]